MRLIERQARGLPSGGSIRLATDIIRVEGVSALYRGLAPTVSLLVEMYMSAGMNCTLLTLMQILKQASNSAYRFGVYQTLKESAIARQGGGVLPNWQTSLIGAIAGTVTGVCHSWIYIYESG